ncbi:hypothetical protein T4D_17197 [Trichinella pseudospiralis]|uniref:Uncharacterized protein n=1 Tax=Trichinella pseudospiralis TaxID=6337 RepID=A0A0V1E595_TRIPS|nr:hypothetical protein T4D_17197 [Trichinella pseudospiralis]
MNYLLRNKGKTPRSQPFIPQLLGSLRWHFAKYNNLSIQKYTHEKKS